MLRVFLARHGETDWNREQRLQGGTDISLNDRGRMQAQQLAERLASEPLDHVYVSSLARARETASAIVQTVPRTVLPELNERRMGSYEGQSLAGFSHDELAEYRRRKFSPDDDLGGGETILEHWRRVELAWRQIRDDHDRGGCVAVIGHGATNALLLAIAAGAPLEVALRYRIHNDDLFLLEVAPAAGARVWQLVLAPGFAAQVS